MSVHGDTDPVRSDRSRSLTVSVHTHRLLSEAGCVCLLRHRPGPPRPTRLNIGVLWFSLFGGRGESGWCLDMTSTHGAWRHAGVQFLLLGVLASFLESHGLLPSPPRPQSESDCVCPRKHRRRPVRARSESDCVCPRMHRPSPLRPQSGSDFICPQLRFLRLSLLLKTLQLLKHCRSSKRTLQSAMRTH